MEIPVTPAKGGVGLQTTYLPRPLVARAPPDRGSAVHKLPHVGPVARRTETLRAHQHHKCREFPAVAVGEERARTDSRQVCYDG